MGENKGVRPTESVEIASSSFKVAEYFGKIKANLKKEGAIIADFDILIASYDGPAKSPIFGVLRLVTPVFARPALGDLDFLPNHQLYYGKRFEIGYQ